MEFAITLWEGECTMECHPLTNGLSFYCTVVQQMFCCDAFLIEHALEQGSQTLLSLRATVTNFSRQKGRNSKNRGEGKLE